MNLLQHLKLEGLQTEDVALTPTKKCFKAVICCSGPISQQLGALLGAEYLWTDRGAPRPFDSSHTIHGELHTPTVKFEGGDLPPIELMVEKLCKVALFREEKRGMQIRVRIHLLEENEGLLFGLLAFLGKLNTEGYNVTVKAAQRSMVEAADVQTETETPELTMYGKDLSATRTFKHKKVTVSIGVAIVDGDNKGWARWWEVRWKGEAERSSGEQPTLDSTVYASENQALQVAATEARFFLESEGITFSLAGADKKAHLAALDFLASLGPQPAGGGGDSHA